MSTHCTHVLLNVLNKLRKRDKMRGFPAFYLFFTTSLMQRWYERHNVSRKSVNHQWFIDFIARHYFTPGGDVIMINS